VLACVLADALARERGQQVPQGKQNWLQI
jgi:hypothetical protein